MLVITLTAGTAVIMWLGELLTEKGHRQRHVRADLHLDRGPHPGRGRHDPADPRRLRLRRRSACSASLVIGAVVFVEQAQRRIPVQYAKRMVGRRMYGGTSTYLPLKVNQAGVIPVIFASSLLYLPQLITQLQGNSTGTGPAVLRELRHQPEQPGAHRAVLRR